MAVSLKLMYWFLASHFSQVLMEQNVSDVLIALLKGWVFTDQHGEVVCRFICSS